MFSMFLFNKRLMIIWLKCVRGIHCSQYVVNFQIFNFFRTIASQVTNLTTIVPLGNQPELVSLPHKFLLSPVWLIIAIVCLPHKNDNLQNVFFLQNFSISFHFASKGTAQHWNNIVFLSFSHSYISIILFTLTVQMFSRICIYLHKFLQSLTVVFTSQLSDPFTRRIIWTAYTKYKTHNQQFQNNKTKSMFLTRHYSAYIKT